MKKTYKKPEIYIESFEISTFIAGQCDIDLGFSADNCGYYDFGGIYLFSTSNSNSTCDEDPDDFDLEGNDGLCYNIPLAGNKIFGS